MIRRLGFANFVSRAVIPGLIMACVLSATTLIAEQLDNTNHTLLDEDEYRTSLEEVVVVGKQPSWRQTEPELWRPEKFELSDATVPSRIQWFPEYNKDERDNYQGVRDRTGENPEFKLFEWKF